MKKFLGILVTLVLLVVCVGCSKTASPDNYTMDKEVEIKKEVSLDQAEAEVEEAADEEAPKYLTFESYIGDTTGTNYTKSTSVVNVKGEKTTMRSTTEVKQLGSEGTVDLYLDDEGYLYTNTNSTVLGVNTNTKTKVKLSNDKIEEYDEIGSDTISEFLDTYLAQINVESENVKIGYDSKGCLIIDVNETNLKLRIVVDQKLPIYFYVEGAGTKVELKFDYSRASVKALDDLDSYK